MSTVRHAHVLVVDDTRVNRSILDRILRSEGHMPILAGSGQEALDLLDNGDQDIDLVLLDIVMPGMDGFGVLAAIKAREHVRHLPVIMVTALEDTESIARCIRAGATDYLVKPIDAVILHARLATSLADKWYRDTEREYLEQVAHLAEAAVEVEQGHYEAIQLESVMERGDSLGQLARTFQRMAREVRDREQRLATQVAELRIEVDSARKEKQVSAITGTSYFKELRDQARELRRLAGEEET